ncbi:MAG: BglG family transcription antiterminator LicT [Velocimicrobium sp.]
MKILKVINNNVVSSINEKKNEVVVMGKGIGFQKKIDDEIDAEKIEKIFSLPEESANQFEMLVKDISYEMIDLAEDIICYAKKSLNRRLSKNIYITLTDHLNFAVERKKQAISFQNALLWEIRKYYNEEYRLGLKAIEMVKERIGIELSEDEAGFIALHFVNAEIDGDMKKVTFMPVIIKDILNIVRYTFSIEIDETTLSYERFVTHLKFFLQRAVRNECYESDDFGFNKDIQLRFSDAYQCALKIKGYMNKKMKYCIADEEITYLTIHISRIIRRG